MSLCMRRHTLIATNFGQPAAGYLPKQWLTTQEVALLLGATVGTIRNKVNNGELTAHKPFGRLLFKRIEIENLIEKSRGGF